MTKSISTFTKFTQNIATFIHNPCNRHQRTATQEFFIGSTILIATIVSIVTPIIGWITLHQTLEAYERQVKTFQQKEILRINRIKSYSEYTSQLDATLKTANRLICKGNQVRLKAYESVHLPNKAFRQQLLGYLDKDYTRTVPSQKRSFFQRKIEYREDIDAFKLDVHALLHNPQYHLQDFPDARRIAPVKRPKFIITEYPPEPLSKVGPMSLIQKMAFFLQNPGNIRNRSALQELCVCIAATMTVITLPVIGWALLYYTSKEYNRQTAHLNQKQLQWNKDLAHSSDLAKSLKTRLKQANAQIKKGNADLLKTRCSIKERDQHFREHIFNLLNTPDLDVSALKAEIRKVLKEEDYQIAACPVMNPIIV